VKIKRYLAKDMPEAVEMIRRDLGPDAVIVSSRKVRTGGWRGLFQPKKLEVTAAVEYPSAGTQQLAVDLRQEVGELKRLIKGLQVRPGQGEEQANLLESLNRWQELLLKLDINHGLVGKLLENMEELSPDHNDPSIKEILGQRIASLFKEPELDPDVKVYCFVGPTGVGKTTTLAKLAAEAALFQHKNIAIITTDTYRIGAIDQLRIYAEILNVPLEVVMTPEELAEVLPRHQDKDAIFVDTAGRPWSNTKQLGELQEFLRVIPRRLTFLVLSCSTKSSDLLQAVRDFQVTEYNQLIFTKADETRSLGTILNVVEETGRAVAYLTTGQNVPEDIMAANPQKLAKMILGAMD
jgi:flagellar biosynthesis protein FlhF